MIGIEQSVDSCLTWLSFLPSGTLSFNLRTMKPEDVVSAIGYVRLDKVQFTSTNWMIFSTTIKVILLAKATLSYSDVSKLVQSSQAGKKVPVMNSGTNKFEANLYSGGALPLCFSSSAVNQKVEPFPGSL
jgi:hypothetical protein